VWNHFLEASIAQAVTATAKTIIAISSTMSDVSSLEKQVGNLNRSIAGWNKAYVWALGIALIVGAFSFWAQRQAISRSRKLVSVSKELSEEKDREVKRDQAEAIKSAGQANERAAKLEKEAAEAQLKLAELKKKQEWRQLDLEKFSNALKGKPEAEVEILYQPDDKEAYTLANMIALGLVGAGWFKGSSFSEPVPIPEDSSAEGFQLKNASEEVKALVKQREKMFPLAMRAGAWSPWPISGVAVASNKSKEIPPPPDDNTPQASLINAFIAGGIKPDPGVVFDLPDNKLRIIVDRKP
jgi:hypothetical protein